MATVMICNTPDTNQRLRTVLNIDGKNTVLYLQLRWHQKINKWMLSVSDEYKNPILRNIPLVGGYSYPSADLLAQFAHLFIGHAATFPFQNAPATPNPTYENLGRDKAWALVWGLPDE